MEPRVVIVGGGFGGLQAAKALAGQAVQVTLIDRCNYHLFQPLLYQVATAGLSPGHIAQPIRAILRDQKNLTVLLAEVHGVDPASKYVVTDSRTVPYDFLIIAAGARHSYFGHPEWEKDAPGLKNIEDAIEIRRRVLLAFELAEKAVTQEERRRQLTFVVVGAGPTGVEMAGAIAELARFTLRCDFRQINPADARILLVDPSPRVLPTFDVQLSSMAERALHRLGVEVRTGMAVKNVTAESVTIGDEVVPALTVVWAAGNNASPIGKSLGAPLDRAGRVIVNDDLSIPSHPEVFVIGDMANFSHTADHKPLPGVSPVAMQQGRHAAKNILATLAGTPRQRFEYHDRGSMATIGRNAAVADLHVVKFNGALAWWTWLFVHLIFLIGFRNRVSVLFQWAWAYLTFAKGARLITGPTTLGRQDEARRFGMHPAPA